MRGARQLTGRQRLRLRFLDALADDFQRCRRPLEPDFVARRHVEAQRPRLRIDGK